MPPDGSEDLLPHYLAELDYLRTAGAEFARRYPRVAGALDLAADGSNDPHVQRLIESFAFLTARLTRSYDAQFPEIPAALLSVLYPQLAAPIPSMSIASFVADPRQARSVAGVTVPSGTSLFASANEGLTCRFRTGYPVALWPIEVADVRLEPSTMYAFLDAHPTVQSVLRIRLRCLGTRRFSEFAPPSLRFYLPSRHGSNRYAIYEMLFTRLYGVGIAPHAADQPVQDGPGTTGTLSPAHVAPVGFDPDEALLPCPPPSHQAYRLLQEYFAFPDKFMFFDVAALPEHAFGDGTNADLLLLLTGAPRHPITVNASSVTLGCTPIINLFSRVTEPIRLDHTRLEYRLVPDSRWESSTEIHSIEQVTRSAARADQGQTIRPLFSLRHTDTASSGGAMYYARRQKAANPAHDGSDILLSFVDPDLNPALPADDTVFARVTCTNRGLAEQISNAAPLDLEIDLPVSAVVCLTRPTRQKPPPATGGMLWRLVSHLSVNHLSLTGGEDGAAALREILLLYCPSDDRPTAQRIAGLTRLATRRGVRHIGTDAWRGFLRGIEIELEYDEQAFAGANAYLMGSVLSRFFGLYGAVNGFTRLVMKSLQRDETLQWPALTGDAALL